MREGIFLSIVLLILIVLNPVSAQVNKDIQAEKPKLVIGIVVENMRPDYIQRFWDKFQANGFKKLYNNGAVCSNVHLTQHIQNYATGTATLFTGVYPSIHGIIDKSWYDRSKKREIDCTEHEFYTTVGAATKEGNASPVELLSNTITDVLKIYSQGKSKVFSAGMNRESSIFSAGHAADAAYWLDVVSGRMVSSSFYINTFPEWTRLFNSENYTEMYSYRNWATFMPETEYTESRQDDYSYERGYFGEWKTFPHSVSKYVKRTKDFRPFKTTPSANLMVKDFVLKLLDNEDIGNDKHTDFVTAIFSSMDYENGSFGPASLEMQDSYLYMDQYIAELIDAVENKYGKENVLFFLTANTSASYPVEYLRQEFNLPVDNFNVESAIALLTPYLNLTYGDNKWIEHYSDLQVYLDHDLIKKNKIDFDEIRNNASNFINQFEGILLSLPSHQLERGSGANGILGRLYKSYDKSRSGDFLFLLKEGWQPTYKFKQVNYTDQSHIPLVFYGAGIQAQKINSKYDGIDFAPTLSELMQIPIPDKCLGNIIEELID
jgi:predicted AlkP superfamily pyrophosphatase or phosphodiesterase